MPHSVAAILQRVASFLNMCPDFHAIPLSWVWATAWKRDPRAVATHCRPFRKTSPSQGAFLRRCQTPAVEVLQPKHPNDLICVVETKPTV